MTMRDLAMLETRRDIAAKTEPEAFEVAVLIPCHDEARSVAQVIETFRRALPAARIYVYDNDSTDDTATVASAAGAVVRSEPWPGKGNVVRRMFADIDVDVYLLVDGDGTYDPSAAPTMVARLVTEHLDMVVGTRRNVHADAHRAGHALGNRAFNRVYRSLFGPLFTDIFSGYRVLSHRFVKSFPAVSSGFEIETEMAVHASQLRMPVAEIETEYSARAAGSTSKLRTVRDAFRILWMQLRLFKDIHPVRFFGTVAVLLVASSALLAYPILVRFIEHHDVPRLPTAVLAMGLVLLAAIAALAGAILDSVAAGRLEQKRLAYLRLPSRHASH